METFSERVALFWEWFEARSEAMLEAIDDGRAADLQAEVTTVTRRLLPGFAWVFGPGEEGGHSFTLSPEGRRQWVLIANAWRDRAPELSRWTFHSSRQPGTDPERMGIQIDGAEVDFAEARFQAFVDDQREAIDVGVWHPVFPTIDQQAVGTIAYLVLDELLGEHGTNMWIGQVDFLEAPPEDGKTMPELRALIDAQAWEKSAPGEAWLLYRLPEPDLAFPRSDTIAGLTLDMSLISDFLDAEGPLPEDPFEGLGVDAVYLSMARSNLPEGEESEARGKIEDKLTETLGKSGIVTGGASGLERAYIDLQLLDGQKSIDLVRHALLPLELIDTALHGFSATWNDGSPLVLS